jgi:hypothetical protein
MSNQSFPRVWWARRPANAVSAVSMTACDRVLGDAGVADRRAPACPGRNRTEIAIWAWRTRLVR